MKDFKVTKKVDPNFYGGLKTITFTVQARSKLEAQEIVRRFKKNYMMGV